jgi:hypothetical protein
MFKVVVVEEEEEEEEEEVVGEFPPSLTTSLTMQ